MIMIYDDNYDSDDSDDGDDKIVECRVALHHQASSVVLRDMKAKVLASAFNHVAKGAVIN